MEHVPTHAGIHLKLEFHKVLPNHQSGMRFKESQRLEVKRMMLLEMLDKNSTVCRNPSYNASGLIKQNFIFIFFFILFYTKKFLMLSYKQTRIGTFGQNKPELNITFLIC